MKKLLLSGALLIGSYLTGQAQTTCANAVTIAGTSSITVPSITGQAVPTVDPEETCYGAYTPTGTTAKAMWYKFTPSSPGIITVNTAIAANPVATTDTRVRILSGSCGAFLCEAGNDDVSASDYRSRISDFIVTGGVTYYIVFDNRWSSAGFTFDFSYTQQSCFVPTTFQYVGAPTANSVTFSWSPPTAGGTPQNYKIEYGSYGFTQGGGETIITPTGATQATISGLNGNSAYEFYIRSECGGFDGNSNWFGPVSFTTEFEPATVPYNMSFDTYPDVGLVGWYAPEPANGTYWEVQTNTTSTPSQNGTNAVIAGPSGAASNAWLYSRPIYLTVGQSYTLTYYMRKVTFAGTGNTNNLKVTYGTNYTGTSHTTLATYNNYASTTYEMKTHTITPDATGVYVVGFNYSAPAHTDANNGAIMVDNVAVTTSTAGTDEVLASRFAVFPNPASNDVTVAGFDALVDAIELMDLNGRTVKSVKVNGVSEAQISIADLASGVYMMNISSDKGMVTKKIVKK